MSHKIVFIRPFVGAKDFELSRAFYRDFGFVETVLEPNLSVFQKEAFAFYLQNAYIKDWVDNTMVFLEVADAGGTLSGKECFIAAIAGGLDQISQGLIHSAIRSGLH